MTITGWRSQLTFGFEQGKAGGEPMPTEKSQERHKNDAKKIVPHGTKWGL